MTKNNRVSVKIINTKGQSSLIEYKDGEISRRVIIPADKIQDGQVSQVVIDAAIPHSYPWDEISFTVGGVHLAEQLHAQGIWTHEDALKNPKKVRSALNAVTTAQFAEVLTIAHRERKGVNNG